MRLLSNNDAFFSSRHKEIVALAAHYAVPAIYYLRDFVQAGAEACLASAHKTKELDTRAALLEFAYEFRTVAKRLERDERAASPIHGECAPR
jgi:hypothetical protein